MPPAHLPEQSEGINQLKGNRLMIRCIWSKARESETVEAVVAMVAIAVIFISVLLGAVALGAAPATAAPAPASGDRTVEVFWSMPDGGTPENVTWPQTHSPDGAVGCGLWYQVDTYTKADAKRFTRDGILEHGEDHGAAISWRFVYGGDCAPEIPEAPDPYTEYGEWGAWAVDCEAGYAERGRWSWSVTWEWDGAEWVPVLGADVADLERRDLTLDEVAACRGEAPDPIVTVSQWEGGTPDCVDPTVEQTRTMTTTEWVPSEDGLSWIEGEPTVTTETREVSLPADELAACTPVTDPEPTDPPAEEPTEPEPTNTQPVTEDPTDPPATQTPVAGDEPAPPVAVDEPAQTPQRLAETGASDTAALGIVTALILMLLGVGALAVRKIRSGR